MTPKQFQLEIMALDERLMRLKNWKWDFFTLPTPRHEKKDTIQNRLKELHGDLASLRFIVSALANVKIEEEEPPKCDELILNESMALVPTL